MSMTGVRRLKTKSGQGESSPQKHFEALLQFVDGKNPESMIQLARAYRAGEGTRQRKDLYFEWMLRAARKGAPDAMREVALCYRNGEGVRSDFAQFFNWARCAIEAGARGLLEPLGILPSTNFSDSMILRSVRSRIWEEGVGGNSSALILLELQALAKMGVKPGPLSDLCDRLFSLNQTIQSIREEHRVRKAPEGVAFFMSLDRLRALLSREDLDAIPVSLYPANGSFEPLDVFPLLSDRIRKRNPLVSFYSGVSADAMHDVALAGGIRENYILTLYGDHDRLDLWNQFGMEGRGCCLVLPLGAFAGSVAEGSPSLPLKVDYKESQARKALRLINPDLRTIERLRRSVPGQGRDRVNALVRMILSDILYLYRAPEYAALGEIRLVESVMEHSDRIHLDKSGQSALSVDTDFSIFNNGDVRIILGPRIKEMASHLKILRHRLRERSLSQRVHIEASRLASR